MNIAEMKKNKRFWMGGGRDASFEWVWADTGRNLNFAPWANSQPNHQGTCLELSSGDEDKNNPRNAQNPFKGSPQLYSKPCTTINNFICHTFTTYRGNDTV